MWRGFLFLGEQSLLVPPGFAFALTATTKKQKTPVVALLTLLGRGSIPCGVLLFLVCCIGLFYVMFKFMIGSVLKSGVPTSFVYISNTYMLQLLYHFKIAPLVHFFWGGGILYSYCTIFV